MPDHLNNNSDINKFNQVNKKINNNGIKSFTKKVSDFFRLVGILIILALFGISSLFAFLVINPDHQFSKWVVVNTPINRIIGLNIAKPETEGTNNSLNNILGLNKDNDSSNFAFSPENPAKSTVEIVNDVIPSVISITVRAKSPTASSATVAGTGIIVSSEGLVVTNKHVIATACGLPANMSNITGITQDQQAAGLTLLSVDPLNDVAILKFTNNPSKLVPVKIADSSKLKLGSEAIAIGNALGQLDNTITKGIISGINRNLVYPDLDECTNQKVNTDGLIQTDAAISKGNSGGPLFDSSGRLIGMNTFGTDEGQNIGLAIPSNIIQSALISFQKDGKITRPRLGLTSQTITPIVKQNKDLPIDYGELIIGGNGPAVIQGSAADKAGLTEGDIILELDGQKLVSSNNNPTPLKRILASLSAGEKIKLTVLKTQSRSSEGFIYKDKTEVIEVALGTVSIDLSNPTR
jgi:S1-C subfamily serine protease